MLKKIPLFNSQLLLGFVLSFILVFVFWAQLSEAQSRLEQAPNFVVKNLVTSQWPEIKLSLVSSNPNETQDSWSLFIAPVGLEVPAQTLTPVPPPPREPYQILVALDTSKSLNEPNLEAARRALVSFSRRLDPKDQLALIAFNDTVQLASSFTTSRFQFAQAVDNLSLSGSKTELYRSLIYSVDLLKNLPGQRVLLVISDGVEDGGSLTQFDVLNSATANKVKIYSIWLALPNTDERHRAFMERLATETQGQFWRVNHPESLSMAIFDVQKAQAPKPPKETVFNLTFKLPEDFTPEEREIYALLRQKVGDGYQTQSLTLLAPEDKLKKPADPNALDPKSLDPKSLDPKALDPKAIAPKSPDQKSTDPNAPAPEGLDSPNSPETAPEPESIINWLSRTFKEKPLILILIAVAAILFVVIMILVLANKKKTRPTNTPTVLDRPQPNRADGGKTVKLAKPNFSPFILEFSDHQKRYPLTLGKCALGATPGNDIIIDASTVSGRHAEFLTDANSCQVKDLNSTNGTLVNGSAIKSFTPLKVGDILKFGSATAMLIRK
ncbi:MAG: FHA domain-containing protein [Deltaproteobacteria bacterium]|jgi:hypothetical protein|nr:FHA domain-containing protein [Deltaproteobacteria bacterium]